MLMVWIGIKFRWIIEFFGISAVNPNNYCIPLSNMWLELTQIFSVFLVSAFKFVVGVGIAIGTMHPLEGFIVTCAGGIFGCALVTFGGDQLMEFFRRRSRAKHKPKFTKRNRFLVKLRRSGGLPVVALLSPVLLSLTVGCLVALTFVHNRKRIMFWMSAAIVFWGIIFFGFHWATILLKTL